MAKKLKPVYPKYDGGGSGLRRQQFSNYQEDPDWRKLGDYNTSAITPGLLARVKGTPAIEPSPVSATPTGTNWQSVFDTAGSMIKPYVSNIVNAFRKPPFPTSPNTVSPVAFSKISMDSTRNDINRSTRSADVAATRSLDEQTAAAVRGANLGKKLDSLGRVSEAEANTNAGIAADAAKTNMQGEMFNAGVGNQFNDAVTSRGIVNQREKSANFANAIDKSIAIDNQDAQRNLDLKKWSVLREIWKQSGVDTRLMARLEKEGILQPGEMIPHAFGGKLRKVFADGGLISGEKKPVFTSQPQVDAANATARRFATMYGHVDPSNVHVASKVGDPMPAFTDGRGRPLSAVPAKQKAYSLPSGVSINDVQQGGGLYWYTDPTTGDVVDVDGSVFSNPRYRKSQEQITTDLAQRSIKAMGGYTRKSKKVF